MKLFSSKKRVAAIGAVTAITLAGGGVAYAYWTSSGSGTGSATTGTDTAFTVVAQTTTGGALTPGGPAQTASFRVRNTGSGAQIVNTVTVSIAEANGDPWTSVSGCSKDDFSLGGESAGTGHTITVGETLASLTNSSVQSVSVQMVNNPTSNQDGCKSATVPLYYSIG